MQAKVYTVISEDTFCLPIYYFSSRETASPMATTVGRRRRKINRMLDQLFALVSCEVVQLMTIFVNVISRPRRVGRRAQVASSHRSECCSSSSSKRWRRGSSIKQRPPTRTPAAAFVAGRTRQVCHVCWPGRGADCRLAWQARI